MKIIVIGAGPAGESAARYAAKKNADVLLVEKDNLGGLCLNRGCIPSKTLLSFGKKLSDIRNSEILNALFKRDDAYFKQEFWKMVQKRKMRVVENLRAGLEKTVQLSGVKTVYGNAEFVSPNELLISSLKNISTSPSVIKEKIESFDRCIVAAGSSVSYPRPLDQYKEKILDSDGVLDLEVIPRSMLIVGGGAVGCEFACLFNELGTEVYIVEKMENLLPGEDEQIIKVLRDSFEKRGIKIYSSTTVSKLEPEDSRWNITLSNQDKIVTDQILSCTGRRPNCDGLNLEKASIKYSPSGIEVSKETLQTSNPSIYAVGDVNGLSLLAHSGSAQGEIAAANALGETKFYKGEQVPRCLYTWPEVASVGLWKRDATAQGIDYKAQKFFFKASGKALAEGEDEGFIQIVSDTQSGKVLGAQIIGSHATEMIHIISVSLRKEMTRSELKEVIFAHPTLSEGIRIALER